MVFISLIAAIVIDDFKFHVELNQYTIQSLVLSLTYAIIIAPSLGYFSKEIVNQTLNEAKLFYIERDSYK